MEANAAVMTSPAAEPRPRNPTSQQTHSVKMITSRDDVTILLLLVIAIFSQLTPLFYLAPVDHAGDHAFSANLSDTLFHALINGPQFLRSPWSASLAATGSSH